MKASKILKKARKNLKRFNEAWQDEKMKENQKYIEEKEQEFAEYEYLQQEIEYEARLNGGHLS